MSELGPWSPKIVQNETIDDVISVIKNSIQTSTKAMGVEGLHPAVTVLTMGNETRLRTRFYLKDKEGFTTNAQPTFVTLAEVVASIESNIKSRSINNEIFEIVVKSKTDDKDAPYTDFIIQSL